MVKTLKLYLAPFKSDEKEQESREWARVFRWKIPKCLYRSREQTKVMQSGTGWKHPAVREARHQHVLQASLLLHAEATPANIGVHSLKGNGEVPGQDF